MDTSSSLPFFLFFPSVYGSLGQFPDHGLSLLVFPVYTISRHWVRSFRSEKCGGILQYFVNKLTLLSLI
jgi:hypothetical protein